MNPGCYFCVPTHWYGPGTFLYLVLSCKFLPPEISVLTSQPLHIQNNMPGRQISSIQLWALIPGTHHTVHTGVSINFGPGGQFSITGGYYFGRPSFLGGFGGMPPGRFWDRRISQTHFPAFWGLLLFCLIVIRSQPIWTNLDEKKNCTSTQIDSRMVLYLSFILFPIQHRTYLCQSKNS